MKNPTVCVLFGGCSPEYGVSLKSAYSVLTNIDRSTYDVIPVGITRDGQWRRFTGDPALIPEDNWYPESRRALLSPDRADHGLLEATEGGLTATWIDVVFPVLHGRNGEDGTVQGLVELAGLPLVGCGTLASAVCMDKDLTHRLVAELGIRTPRGVRLEGDLSPEAVAERTAGLPLPLFVKPLRAGSSFGITRVERREEIYPAVRAALEHDSQVLVEEAVPGFEVGCAVLGTGELTIGEIDEIELSGGFFDYTEKYTLKTAAIHMPARVPEAVSRRVKAAAERIYRCLGLTGFARIDLFCTPEGELVFNEVNTIPGFTAASRYPGMLRGVGLTYPEIVDALIQDALNHD